MAHLREREDESASKRIQGNFGKHGLGAASFVAVAVLFWVICLITLPQVAMLDYSFRFNLPAAEVGGPQDVYTLENYSYFFQGNDGTVNTLDIGILFKTLIAAVFVTCIDILLCYPIAFILAHSATGVAARMMVIGLIVPFWVNEILRAFAFRVLFGSTGLINGIGMSVGLWDQPVDFIRADVALYSGLTYAYILLMVFPIFNAVEALTQPDRSGTGHGRKLVAGALAGGAAGCQAGHRLRGNHGVHADGRCACSTPDPRRSFQSLVHPAHLPMVQRERQLATRFGLCGDPADCLHLLRHDADADLQGFHRGDRPMNRGTGGGVVAAGFSLLFFTFLFGPLIIMVITAFNSSSFPRITPWECFTTDWFGVLFANDRLMRGLANSLVIAISVVVIAVPIGLAGALALSELGPRLRAALYTVLITPILIPGVVLGISTIVFWGAFGRSVGADYGSIFYNGMFLTLAGQVTFISAYAMLVFLARLQRFDPILTEAALDLGATPGQAFRKILLPFLWPAIGSAAFLTFLASFENNNTTVFTILSGNTFTTALASKVRHGTDPSLSALAVIIIGITLIGAVVHEATCGGRK